MEKYLYKCLKYMINNPNNNFSDISKKFDLNSLELSEIIRELKERDFASLDMSGYYDVSFKGKLFSKNYKSDIIKSIFKNYLFQIILSLLTFALGLLSGYLLK